MACVLKPPSAFAHVDLAPRWQSHGRTEAASAVMPSGPVSSMLKPFAQGHAGHRLDRKAGPVDAGAMLPVGTRIEA